MQVVKIFLSRPRLASKEANKPRSYYLGFHADPRWSFESMNGATLDFVKQHLESFGGKVVRSLLPCCFSWLVCRSAEERTG